MPDIRHRLSQGLRALLAFAQPPDRKLARNTLTDCEYAAFIALSRADQLHSLRVLRNVLKAQSRPPRSLATAALLHDVGKARYHLSVWQKTLAVLLAAVAPGLSRRLGDDQRLNWWRAPFVVRRNHAAWGGAILRECGADEAVIWLVEQHQADAGAFEDHPWHQQLIQLQRADRA